jgi:spoIIIJ-associated protein
MNVNDATPDTTEAEQSPTQEPLAAEQAPEQSAPTESAPAAEQQEDAQFTTEQPVTEQAADQAVPDPSAEASPEDGGTESENAGGADPEEDAETDEERLHRLEAEGDIAADYLEGLLDIADLDGDIDMDVEADRAAVSIISDSGGRDLQKLVGRDGEVLEALQELTRLAVHRETGDRSRLMLDIAGYRAKKRAELSELGAKTAAEVKSTGEPVKMQPMTPFERKVVHDAVKAAGLRSESEGEEPQRFVVVLPA